MDQMQRLRERPLAHLLRKCFKVSYLWVKPVKELSPCEIVV